MAYERYKAEGRFPPHPSRQDTRFLPSNNSSRSPADIPRRKPPKTRHILGFSVTIKNVIAYLPRRLYYRIKFHSRNQHDGIQAAHSVVSPSSRQSARTSSSNAVENIGRIFNDGETIVGSSIYSDDNDPRMTPQRPNGTKTISGTVLQLDLNQEAQLFADGLTGSFRQRLAKDFADGDVFDLDEYSRMGELGTLEEALWERKESRRRREREQWRSDTGFGSGGEL